MKKLLTLILGIILTSTAVFAQDIRFVQVDNLLYSPQNQNFPDLVNDINRQKNVEFVIFSGNNISKPDKTYLEEFLKEANKLKTPYYIALGNKDVNKQKELGKAEYIKLVSKHSKAHKKITSPNYVFERNGLIFIVVDGSKDVIPSTMGYYKADVLEWLETQLTEYKDKNVVIIQHFPIIPPAKKENYYTYKADKYLEVISKYPNIKAVISGHFGVDKEQKVNNVIHLSTSSAPTYKIIDITDCDSTEPIIWSIVKSSN